MSISGYELVTQLAILFSKTAQVVLVENFVPPQALCLTRKSPTELGSYCLPRQEDLTKPRGRDADQAPIKEVSYFWTSDFFACDNY